MERITGKDQNFVAKATRYLFDKVLDSNIVDTVVVGTLSGAAILQERIASLVPRKTHK